METSIRLNLCEYDQVLDAFNRKYKLFSIFSFPLIAALTVVMVFYALKIMDIREQVKLTHLKIDTSQSH